MTPEGEAVYLGAKSSHGWAPEGERCVRKSTFNRRNKYSYVVAIDKDNVIAHQKKNRAFKGADFAAFLENDVIPNMKNRAILMDNATIHKTRCVKDVLTRHGITAIYNVPYSPQFNPIEFFFNTFKAHLKRTNTSTERQLDKAVVTVIRKETQKGFSNYFEHTAKNLATAIANVNPVP